MLLYKLINRPPALVTDSGCDHEFISFPQRNSNNWKCQKFVRTGKSTSDGRKISQAKLKR